MNKWGALLFLLLLAVAPFGLTQLERYVVTDQQLLENPLFESGLSAWNLRGAGEVFAADGEVSIVNRQHASQNISQRIGVTGPGIIRFSLQAQTDRIVTGSVPWAGASATVSKFDSDANFIHQRVAFALKADAPPQHFTMVEHYGSNVADIVVTLRLLRSAGVFKARQLVVSALEESGTYQRARVLVIVSWALAAFVVAVYLMSILTIGEFVFLSGIGALSLAGMALPGLVFSRLKQVVIDALPEPVLGILHWLPNAGLELGDLLHFLLFFVVGAMLGLKVRIYGACFGLASILVIAVFTESLQMFVHGRSTSLSDLIIDVAGGALGFSVLLIIGRLYSLQQRKTLNYKFEHVTECHENNRHPD